MSILYYCGVDQLIGLTSQKICQIPEKVDDNIWHLESSLDLVVYCKSSAKFEWFLKGYKISNPVEIFTSSLEVDQVQICKSTVYGLSTLQNKLYKVVLNFSSDPVGQKFSDITPASTDSSDNDTKFIQIAADDNNLFVLDDQSGVYKWPTLLFRSDGVKFIKMSCGFDHALLLSDAGAVYAFGNGSRGQLGLQEIVMRADTPMRIEFFDDLPCTITDIACGGWHCLVLTSDGDTYSFGWNPVGQLGHSNDLLSQVVKDPYPVDLGSADNPIIAVAAGARHSLALLQSGDVYSWGWNKYSQLGTGDTEDRSSPTLVEHSFLTGRAFRIQAGRWGSFIYCHHKMPR